jgi:hypothetical protein
MRGFGTGGMGESAALSNVGGFGGEAMMRDVNGSQ